MKITPCDKCGNTNLDWDRNWHISDKERLRVVPEQLRNKTLCPWCFVKLALKVNRHYQPKYYKNTITGLTCFGVQFKTKYFDCPYCYHTKTLEIWKNKEDKTFLYFWRCNACGLSDKDFTREKPFPAHYLEIDVYNYLCDSIEKGEEE